MDRRKPPLYRRALDIFNDIDEYIKMMAQHCIIDRSFGMVGKWHLDIS